MWHLTSKIPQLIFFASNWPNIFWLSKFSHLMSYQPVLALSDNFIFRRNVYYEKKIILSVCRLFSQEICQFSLKVFSFQKKLTPKCFSGHVECSFDTTQNLSFRI